MINATDLLTQRHFFPSLGLCGMTQGIIMSMVNPLSLFIVNMKYKKGFFFFLPKNQKITSFFHLEIQHQREPRSGSNVNENVT